MNAHGVSALCNWLREHDPALDAAIKAYFPKSRIPVKPHKKGNKPKAIRAMGWMDKDKKEGHNWVLAYLNAKNLWVHLPSINARKDKLESASLVVASFYKENKSAWRIEEWLLARADESGIQKDFPFLTEEAALKEHCKNEDEKKKNEIKQFFKELFIRNNPALLKLIEGLGNYFKEGSFL